jgi:hypothetical protein
MNRFDRCAGQVALVVVLASLVAAACGSRSSSHGGFRIYDATMQIRYEVRARDVRRSSLRDGHDGPTWFVYMRLTPRGGDAFHDLTRALALRGSKLHQNQKIAIAVNGRVATTNEIDYTRLPDGIADADTSGIEMTGLSKRDATELVSAIRNP